MIQLVARGKLDIVSVAALAFAAVAQLAFAQPSSKTNWDNLKQLAPGTEIQVRLTDGRNLRGTLQSIGNDALTITTANSQEMLAQSMCVKVSSRGPSHRKRNTLIGLAAGAGTGLIIGAVADHSTCNNSNTFCFDPVGPNFGKAVFTPIGAIVGVVVGVLIPSGGWREVYRLK